MENGFPEIGRNVSILDRLMKMYYDRGLAGFEIGWGQQFYAEYIYDHPGASAQDMVRCIHVDKATLTKTVKKLTDIGYVDIRCDERDRRVKRLYLTQAGEPAVRRIKEIHAEFRRVLCEGMTGEEAALCEELLRRMAENAGRAVKHRMEEQHGQ